MESLWSHQLRERKPGELPRLEAEVLAARPWTREGVERDFARDAFLEDRPSTGPTDSNRLSPSGTYPSRLLAVSCSQSMSASLRSTCSGARPNPRRCMAPGRSGCDSLNASTSSCSTSFRKSGSRFRQSPKKSDVRQQQVLPPWHDLRALLASTSQAYPDECLARKPGTLQLYGPMPKHARKRDRSPLTTKSGYHHETDFQSLLKSSWENIASTCQDSVFETPPKRGNPPLAQDSNTILGACQDSVFETPPKRGNWQQEQDSYKIVDLTDGPEDALNAYDEFYNEEYFALPQEPVKPAIELLEQVASRPCTATLELASPSGHKRDTALSAIDATATSELQLPIIESSKKKCDSPSKSSRSPNKCKDGDSRQTTSEAETRPALSRHGSMLAESIVSRHSEFSDACYFLSGSTEIVEEESDQAPIPSERTPRGRFRSSSAFSGGFKRSISHPFSRSITSQSEDTSVEKRASAQDALPRASRSSFKPDVSPGTTPKGQARQSIISPKGQNRQPMTESLEANLDQGLGDEASPPIKEPVSPMPLLDHGPPPMLAQLFDSKKKVIFEACPSKREAYEKVGFDTILSLHSKYQKYHLDVWEVILRWEEFVNLDVSGTGYLSFEEFKQGLKETFKLGEGPVPPHLLDEEWRSFQGEIDFTAYLEWAVQHAFTEEVLVPDEKDRRLRQLAREMGIFLTTIERIKSVYDRFDSNGSGLIDREEFTQVMTVLMKVQSPQDISEKMLDRYWHEVDVNFSGHIDFEEFLQWYTLYFED